MLTDTKDIIQEVGERLSDYDIQNNNDFEEALHEVIDGMVDIYYDDIFDSIQFLYFNCDFTEMHEDIVIATQRAQYDYYMDTVYDNLQEVTELANVIYLEEE